MLWSGFDYEPLLGLGVFEDEKEPIEIQLENRSLCARDAPICWDEKNCFRVQQI